MNSLRTAKRFVFPLLGLWVLLYASFSLVKPPLLDGTDSVQAEAAREMAWSGHWLHATVNGVPAHHMVTPLTWATAASFKAFGVNDRAARVPQALFALGLFAIAFALGSRLFLTPVVGFYTALALLSSYGVFLFGHLLVSQLLATFANVLAIYFFWRTYRKPSLRFGVAFGAACALGFFAAGALGAVTPLMTVLVFLLWTRKQNRTLLAGLVAFVVLGTLRPLLTHAWGEGEPYLHKTPILLFWAFLLIAMLPWSLFSIAALKRVREAFAHPGPRDFRQEAWMLLGIWTAVAIVAVSLSSHREPWILPVLPPMALLAAGWLTADELKLVTRGRIFAQRMAWGMFAAGLIAGGAAIFLAWHVAVPPSGSDVATLLHLHSIRSTLLFGHLNDLSVAMMGTFHVPLLIFAASLIAGVTTNLWYRSRGQARLANCFLAGMMIFCLLAAHLALHTFSPVVSSAIIAEAIKPEVDTEDAVVVNGAYRDASALPFYLERNVLVLHPVPQRTSQGSAATDGIDEASLAAMWASDRRIFLWSSPSEMPDLPGTVYLIARAGGREIVSNQPNNGGAAF